MSSIAALKWLERSERESIARLIDWLRIPSISTDPIYRGDVRRAGQWALDQLRELGFTAELRETGAIGADGLGAGHPIVLATCLLYTSPSPRD